MFRTAPPPSQTNAIGSRRRSNCNEAIFCPKDACHAIRDPRSMDRDLRVGSNERFSP